jgi:LemA protein
VQAALAEAAKAASLMGSSPVVVAHAAAWVAAEAALSASTTRLFALLDQHSDLHRQPDVAAGARDWRDADSRLAFTRQLFNEAGQGYNAAIALFPTRLLVPLFRFGQAGRI